MPFVFHNTGIPVRVGIEVVVKLSVIVGIFILPTTTGFSIDSDVIRRSSRWKRQSLPSDNVQVYSINSNVSITEDVEVNSRESRIELKETRFDGTIWSKLSSVHFDPNKGYVNLTAEDVVATFTLNRALFEADGDGNTELLAVLQNDVNLSFTDSTSTEIEAANGKQAIIHGQSWQLKVDRRLELFSTVVSDLQRQLLIISMNDDYNIQITLLGAQVGMLYGKVRVDIGADYRSLVLTSEGHRVELKTVLSPFNLSITDQELAVRCADEHTTLRIMRDSSEIAIDVDELSALHMDRSGGSYVSVEGRPSSASAERLDLNSLQLALRLNSEERNRRMFSLIRAQSNRSQLIMQTNMTRVNLVAAHHLLDILGGAPHLYLDTGNITLDISTNREGLSAVTLLPAFTTPVNRFTNIGPFNGDSGSQIAGSNTGWIGLNTRVTRPGISGNIGQVTVNPNENVSAGSGKLTVSPTSQTQPGGLTGSATVHTLPEGHTIPGGVGATTPIYDSIEDDFPRPGEIADNFTFQQFGPDIATPKGSFWILATLSNISMAETTTIFPQTAAFPQPNDPMNFFPEAPQRLRKTRDVEHSSMLEMHLHVDDQKKIREKRFLKDLEEALSEIAENVFYPNTSDEFTRKKRNLQEVKIKIDKTEVSRHNPNDVNVLFYVDQPEDFTELPWLATKLNDVGPKNLTERIGYPVVSEIMLREPSPNAVVVIAVSTSTVVLIMLFVLMGWQCKVRERRVMAYLRRSRVSDSTAEINRIPTAQSNVI